jgi:MOSC domain-containing protein YiiM
MRTAEELEAGLAEVRRSPTDGGTLDLIVRRPEVGEREVVEHGELDLHQGLVGDNWGPRGSRHTEDGSAERDRQLTVMNARAAALFAGDPERRSLAGDQLFVDLDLSLENLPAGTRLSIGSAVIEVSPLPHTGCAKFRQRFGPPASKLVASPVGRELNLRGINARVVVPGRIAVGDRVRKAP